MARKVNRGIAWTEEELEFLKEHYGEFPVKHEIFTPLRERHSVISIRSRASALGLKASDKKHHKWTEQEMEWLKLNYHKFSVDSEAFDVIRKRHTRYSIVQKAEELKLISVHASDTRKKLFANPAMRDAIAKTSRALDWNLQDIRAAIYGVYNLEKKSNHSFEEMYQMMKMLTQKIRQSKEG